MPDLPIACTLDPAALEARREDLLTTLVRRSESIEAIPNGRRLRFSSADDILALISRTIAAERQCCRFLRFQVTVEPDGGPIELELTGPKGSGEFLAALLEP